ncbi:sulfite reductase subunit alpha [Azomonas macrocytogenes]|uniref:NADPH--hemoprotein reductase n=1 Tax=Azomonas macrocytogenes TaxID=69962 RepID=A0A839T276_AZOMA|nr:sulfite reductase subunit alpha [Azomonas macrocytogenes]MBB3102055.1 sulfite reductase (NADPH) flavoprotein alpha-component [Azomonas macrocytogenes]
MSVSLPSAGSPGYWSLLGAMALAAFLFSWQPPREVSAALVGLGYLGLCAQAWQYHRRLRSPPIGGDILCVAYASQGGQARHLAERSAAQLNEAGLTAQALPLNELSERDLQRISHLLLVASTYGEGEAPDNAARFEQYLNTSNGPLTQLKYAMLALGDSRYRHFCGFAKRLDLRLRERGALALFDRLDADRGDASILRQWQRQLSQLTGDTTYQQWQTAAFEPWTLARRTNLNPDSQGLPVFHLQLTPASGRLDWQAGDIAEIGPCQPLEKVASLLQQLQLNGAHCLADGRTLAWHLARRRLPADLDGLEAASAEQLLASLPLLPHRDYSIASIPADGHLDLLVRCMTYPDGSLGLASGWLCQHAAAGTEIDLRIRANPGFRLAENCGPLILIGNGTGLAGLRAHLRERQQLGQHGHWLLFGERNAAHDSFFREELETWRRTGHLARLDLVFSRDQAERLYVQHRLRDAADELRAWVNNGAHILLCGSLEGMGREIDTLLHGLLGTRQMTELMASGHYRRDLY